MRQSFKGIVIFLLAFQSAILWGKSFHKEGVTSFGFIFQDSLEWADYYYNIHRYRQAIPLYEKSLDTVVEERTRILKKLALSEAAIEHPSKSVSYIHEYLQLEFRPSFLLHEGFDSIRTTDEFGGVSERVIPKINIWAMLYFFVALIGFYVMGMLLLNKKIDNHARIIIAIFVFIHSFFILNISINSANYLFEIPHSYLMSTWSSFLYGPLLFLYFRRVSKRHKFTWGDLWHFLPTLLLIGYLIPNVYAFTGEEKVNLMLSRLQNGVSPEDSSKLILIVTLKAISLAVYAYFIHLLLKKNTKNGRKERSKSKTRLWQKNIYYIHVAYVITYIVYGASISLSNPYPVLFHTPIIMMAIMVVYVGYAANVQPNVFTGVYAYTNNRLFPKYVKSGLTESLSLELKENLAQLFEKERLYRRNDINLDLVARKLGTTRHNASQIINEHFKKSFHEFVNVYRIKEATELLEKEIGLNIIDIAYEVGYNNKVTFNKAFKKETSLTPSQYLWEIQKKKSPSLSELGHY
ncbi:MAG: helix-turn-helix domain-containing protein [Bacteroidota bacterium]